MLYNRGHSLQVSSSYPAYSSPLPKEERGKLEKNGLICEEKMTFGLKTGFEFSKMFGFNYNFSIT